MGYLIAMAPCVRCHVPFEFNSERVPSAIVNGVRQPLCRGCVDVLNSIRIQMGLAPMRPLPGAYAEMEAV